MLSFCPHLAKLFHAQREIILPKTCSENNNTSMNTPVLRGIFLFTKGVRSLVLEKPSPAYSFPFEFNARDRKPFLLWLKGLETAEGIKL